MDYNNNREAMGAGVKFNHSLISDAIVIADEGTDDDLDNVTYDLKKLFRNEGLIDMKKFRTKHK